MTLATPPKIVNSVIFGPMSVRSDGAASAVFCKVQRFDKMWREEEIVRWPECCWSRSRHSIKKFNPSGRCS
jgi:hypothetical protein